MAKSVGEMAGIERQRRKPGCASARQVASCNVVGEAGAKGIRGGSNEPSGINVIPDGQQ